MRYVTVDVYPDAAALHPLERRFAAADRVRREAIHAVEQLADGSFAFLLSVAGDPERSRDLLADAAEVTQFAVTDDGSGLCYSRVESAPVCEELLAHRRREEFVVRMPIQYTDDGARRVTIVGREGDLVGSALDLPDAYRLELVSKGRHRPAATDRFADLTDRQREVLEVAVDLGYYETPREATLADVADRVGVTPGTAGKHLRAVESRVFTRDALDSAR